MRSHTARQDHVRSESIMWSSSTSIQDHFDTNIGKNSSLKGKHQGQILIWIDDRTTGINQECPRQTSTYSSQFCDPSQLQILWRFSHEDKQCIHLSDTLNGICLANRILIALASEGALLTIYCPLPKPVILQIPNGGEKTYKQAKIH